MSKSAGQGAYICITNSNNECALVGSGIVCFNLGSNVGSDNS